MRTIILSLIVMAPALAVAGPPSDKDVLAKQEQARSRVEAMISRLKSLEQHT